MNKQICMRIVRDGFGNSLCPDIEILQIDEEQGCEIRLATLVLYSYPSKYEGCAELAFCDAVIDAPACASIEELTHVCYVKAMLGEFDNKSNERRKLSEPIAWLPLHPMDKRSFNVRAREQASTQGEQA